MILIGKNKNTKENEKISIAPKNNSPKFKASGMSNISVYASDKNIL